MKIVIHTMEQIAGVEIFPIISLLLFFIFFMIVGYMVLTADKKYIEEMKNLPLDKNNDLNDKNHLT